MSIPEFFQKQGEQAFRAIEFETLQIFYHNLVLLV